MQLSEFLEKTKLQAQNIDEVTYVVMGNESADPDSMVSTIAHAYLLSCDTAFAKLYLPVINIPRSEYQLRRESIYLLNLIGLDPAFLIFEDEISLNDLQKHGKLHLTLVDHNVLKLSHSGLSDAVMSIVDHHHDENKFYPLLTENNKKIAPVGSTATLIAENYACSHHKVPSELALLLLGAILFDTHQLQSQSKTTSRDIEAATYLQNVCRDLVPTNYYAKIVEHYEDTDGLDADMLLTKDFKIYQTASCIYGIASLPKKIDWWIHDENWLLPILDKFAKQHNLLVLILLFATNAGIDAKRKLITFSFDQKYLSKMNDLLTNSGIFSTIHHSIDEHFIYYESQAYISRKQIVPILNLL